MAPKKSTAGPLPKVNPTALKGMTVIVSGEVEDYPRAAAHQVLESAGAVVAKSLNKSVQLVVLGADPGAKKLEKIDQMGVETKEWDVLLQEIEAGGTEPEGDDVVPVVADEDAEAEGLDDDEVEEEKPKAKGKAKAKAPAKATGKARGAASESKSKAKSGSAKTATGSSDLSSDFSLDGKSVLVTGTVAGHTRKTANDLLESHGAHIAKSLTADLDLVILGAKPGPDKTSKIAELGLSTVEWGALASHLGLDYHGDDGDSEPEPQTLSGAPASIDGTTVLVTGTVDGHTRATAQKALQTKGAVIAKGLNKDVELVVLGVNPGPDKLKKINDLGIPTCRWEDLAKTLGLANAGEPPKKKRKA